MALGTNGRAPILIDPEGGLISDFESAFKAERDDRAGPLAHLWAQWRGDLGGVMPEYPDPEIETVQRPLVSTGEYVAGVDPDRVKKLNVIVVVIESLRPDQLVAFGGSRPVMDRVDALAASGRIFPNTYSQASHSNYADPCIFSSAYPLRSPDVHVYPENPTYPRLMLWDILKALGWHTAVISSQNEHWGGMINYLQTDGIDHFFHSESFTGATYVPRDDIGFFAFVKTGRRSGKIDDRFTVDEAVRWIQTLPSGEPFMIYLNLQNSHIPYETPADFPHRYGPVDRPFSIHFGGFPRSGIQVVKDLYADSLAYVDFQLGRLLDFIQSQGIADRTLVVVTGDTGQAFYEHGFVAHANMVFDEEMRVPLIFNGSGISPGEDRRPAQHIDVAPTVLDALGLPPHPAFQGISLLETEPSPARSRFLMAHSPLAHQYAVVRGGFKLIYDVPTGRTVLYNVVEDPGEKHDLAPSMPNLTRSLRGRLDAWRQHQLDYYHDATRQARFYPPVLVD